MEVNAMLAVGASKLLAGDDNGVVSKWDVERGVQELTLREHSLGVRALARVSDHSFASGSLDTAVCMRAD